VPEDRLAAFRATARLPCLDGLRALSIVPVVWHHACAAPRPGLLGRGPLGVDLFFAISGFLITTLLLRERAAQRRVDVAAFYARRTLRIFPLYYVVLAAFALHAFLLREPGPLREHFLRSLPFYATYTANWFVDFDVPHPIVFAFAWSLATEEQFYLVYPWLLSARSLVVPAVVTVAALTLDLAAEGSLGGAAASIFADHAFAARVARSFATPIGLGALVALGLHTPALARPLGAIVARRWSAPAAFIALAIAVVWPLSPLAAHAAMAALVAAAAARSDHLLARALEADAVRHVGVVSYGVYLLHVPVLTVVRRAMGAEASDVLVFAAVLVLSIGAATITHRWLERPCARLSERFVRAPRTDRAVE
jgi:peptidoglycan/LPS O-acetylase OafA/YrhL